MSSKVGSESRKLYRSENDRIIGGVAGGLADYFNCDVVLVRIVTALAILSGGGLLVYIIMWLIVPTESAVTGTINKQDRSTSNRPDTQFGRYFLPVALIGFGIVLLLNNFQIFPWYVWNNVWKFWPVLLILLGLKSLGK